MWGRPTFPDEEELGEHKRPVLRPVCVLCRMRRQRPTFPSREELDEYGRPGLNSSVCIGV